MSSLSFSLSHTDSATSARRGTLTTRHGVVDTPAFMPVGTRASIKGLTLDQVRATGAQMLLANTYHLLLRPGEKTIEHLGGLHAFMGWDGPILTDSGGYQVFSLASMAKITDFSAVFRSHLDGTLVELSPERAVQIQEALGSDVAMVLDHVVRLPSDREMLSDAVQRTLRWAARSQEAHRRTDQALFAITQGGLDIDLRLRCSEQLVAMNFPGYAIGGLSVGESPAEMYRVLDETVAALPADKPRYLMGVGRPADLLEAIGRGIDLFDCVLPTRNGRNALAFTPDGNLRLRNLQYERDPRPVEEGCPCLACRHSRGYLRHLFITGEMLGPILLTIHNITHYQGLMNEARVAISEDQFDGFRSEKLRRMGPMGSQRP